MLIDSIYIKRALETLPLLIILLVIVSCSSPRDDSVPSLYSIYVKDSFKIYIDLPPNYSSETTYSIAFYMDANLKMGKEIRRQIRLDENRENLKNVIFVGVGHIGDYRKLRRRDFIPPVYENGEATPSQDEYFGHADDFYKFLVFELVPYINQNYTDNGRYTFIGHSFSGLFAFYCLMKSEIIFVNHVALSPSLWVNYDNFFEIEEMFYREERALNTMLYHSCGSLEWTNKVLYSSRQMKNTLIGREYAGLRYKYVEHEGKGHNGVVSVSLEYILKSLRF
ncbi:MAG: alpha/beta hydrolase-fold protein [Bacteroidota bacterium]